VFVPAAFQAAAACVTQKLADQFTSADGKPKKVDVDGVKVTFEHITFQPFVRDYFERGKLDILPPKDGTGQATGDFGLGRQQLLLSWLLDGEYVALQTYAVDGVPLDQVLQAFTGIPLVEGHEAAMLQRLNLLESKAFLRIKGAEESDSSFHELFVTQLRDASNAVLRAALARMVADPQANAIVLNVRRTTRSPGTQPAFSDRACLSIEDDTPASWTPKPCAAFEEYIASLAGLTVQANLTLFGPDEVANLIHKSWRLVGGIDPITEEDDPDRFADRFISDISKFIGGIAGDVDPQEGAILATREVYEQRIDVPDAPAVAPDRTPAKRRENLLAVHQKILAASKNRSLPIVPHVSNKGAAGASQVQLRMFRGEGPGPGQPAEGTAAPLRVDLDPNDEKFLTAQFVLGDTAACEANPQGARCAANAPFDLNPADPKWVAFTLDLPEKKTKEANRENNVGGFFYYVLDRINPIVPFVPDKIPLPLPDPHLDMLKGDDECEAVPELEVSQSINVGGESTSDLAIVQPLSSATLEFVVTNKSEKDASNVTVCSSLTGKCYPLGILSPNEAGLTLTDSYTAPVESRIIDGLVTVSSKQTGIQTGSPLRVIVACEATAIVALDPDENPITSRIPNGGTAVRKYRVIDRRTGSPMANSNVTLEIGMPNAVTQPIAYSTDGDGAIVTDGEPDSGMVIRFDAAFPLNTPLVARITAVAGTPGYCGSITTFTIIQEP
jgi:hypothetical protein